MRLPLMCLLVVVTSGCVSYRFEHVNLDGTKDVTKFFAFVYVGNASKIKSMITSTNYNRTVSVGEVSGKGDVDLIKAIIEGAVAAAAKAATSGAAP